MKYRPSLVGVALPPRARPWGFLNGHLLSSEKWVGEDFWSWFTVAGKTCRHSVLTHKKCVSLRKKASTCFMI
jgi:hypothetical protein